MKKNQTLETNMVFVCYLFFKEANIHINLICFHRNVDHPHIIVVTFIPRKQPKMPHFFHKNSFFLKKMFNMYPLLGLFSLFSQYKRAFLKKLSLNCRTFQKLTRNILSDCFGASFVPLVSKKAKLSKWPKSRENRTNMDIILLFLVKPLDKHGITLVRITYPPLRVEDQYFIFFNFLANFLTFMNKQ